MAVSKTKPKEAVIEAYKAGQRVFGENYIQVKNKNKQTNKPTFLTPFNTSAMPAKQFQKDILKVFPPIYMHSIQ